MKQNSGGSPSGQRQGYKKDGKFHELYSHVPSARQAGLRISDLRRKERSGLRQKAGFLLLDSRSIINVSLKIRGFKGGMPRYCDALLGCNSERMNVTLSRCACLQLLLSLISWPVRPMQTRSFSRRPQPNPEPSRRPAAWCFGNCGPEAG